MRIPLQIFAVKNWPTTENLTVFMNSYLEYNCYTLNFHTRDMTTANLDDLIPIAFETAAEFQSRDKYQDRLQCTDDVLERIVGKYVFSEKDKLQCGLNGCRSWHWHGYVIRTKNGGETHCGQYCGFRAFKVLFKDVEAAYKAAEDRKGRLDFLRNLLEQRDDLMRKAINLEAQASEAGSRIHILRTQFERDSHLERAFRDCLRNTGRILIEDENSRRLRAAMGAAADKADLKTIGVVRGTSAFGRSGTILLELKYKVILPLENMTEHGLQDLDNKQLMLESTSLGSIKQILSATEQFLRDYQMLNTKENLETFRLLLLAMPKKFRTNKVHRIFEKLADRLIETPAEIQTALP